MMNNEKWIDQLINRSINQSIDQSIDNTTIASSDQQ